MKILSSFKIVTLATGAAALLLCTTPAHATPIVDQTQYSWNTGFPYEFPGGPLNYPVGQSFTAGLTGLLTDITVESNGQIQSGGTLTMDILAGDGTSGTLLGTYSGSYPFLQPFDFGLNRYAVGLDVSSLGINVVAGLQYTFLFTNVTGSDFPTRGLLANNQNPYAGGRAYSGPGYGNLVAPWDLAFETKVDQAVPDSGVTSLMIGSALLGLVALRRRFRA